MKKDKLSLHVNEKLYKELNEESELRLLEINTKRPYYSFDNKAARKDILPLIIDEDNKILNLKGDGWVPYFRIINPETYFENYHWGQNHTEGFFSSVKSYESWGPINEEWDVLKNPLKEGDLVYKTYVHQDSMGRAGFRDFTEGGYIIQLSKIESIKGISLQDINKIMEPSIEYEYEIRKIEEREKERNEKLNRYLREEHKRIEEEKKSSIKKLGEGRDFPSRLEKFLKEN